MDGGSTHYALLTKHDLWPWDSLIDDAATTSTTLRALVDESKSVWLLGHHQILWLI